MFVESSIPSLPGLTRQSIPLALPLVRRNGMDARIKSGHDGARGEVDSLSALSLRYLRA